MSSKVRPWIALALLAFVGMSAVQPAIAAAAPGDPAAAGAPAPAPAPAPAAAPPVAPVPPPAPAPVQGGAPPPPAGYYQPPPGTPYPPPYGYPPPPPGYAPYPPYGPTANAQLVKVHRPRRGLVTAGAVTFGVTWGIAASISLILEDTCSSNCTTRNYFWIPVAGPLIVGLEENEATSFFVLWSAAEAAGIAMFVVGVMGHEVMEYRIARNGPTLQLAPMFARDTSGMMLTARW